MKGRFVRKINASDQIQEHGPEDDLEISDEEDDDIVNDGHSSDYENSAQISGSDKRVSFPFSGVGEIQEEKEGNDQNTESAGKRMRRHSIAY